MRAPSAMCAWLSGVVFRGVSGALDWDTGWRPRLTIRQATGIGSPRPSQAPAVLGPERFRTARRGRPPAPSAPYATRGLRDFSDDLAAAIAALRLDAVHLVVREVAQP